MHVLITGGCGFIGTNLAARLSGGTRIRVFDNESLGRREHLNGLDVEFVHGDLRDRAGLDAALDGIDAVVHLAADTRVVESIEAPRYNFDVRATFCEIAKARQVLGFEPATSLADGLARTWKWFLDSSSARRGGPDPDHGVA